MATLAEIVSRRTDLGTFVVHITRTYKGRSAKRNLEAILRGKQILARSPFGSAVKALQSAIRDSKASDDDLNSQKAVCFTETPLEHLHLMLAEITDIRRACQFAPYGIAMTKKIARERGVNPIWYVDITPGHDWLTNPINNLVAEAITSGNFADSHIARLTPFIEQMGSFGGLYRKEFWWEREWRHRGDFQVPRRVILIAPEAEHREFAEMAEDNAVEASFIDPKWGLEAIIARLAGFDSDEIGPF
jgi:hypothetical protein